ncbi:MAG TPA: VCBS repeat-containing protein [Pyrinomonadaceae bacterium]|nr:VCBS repeat-containing protein [Pyrinomonadaceae bacterium]
MRNSSTVNIKYPKAVKDRRISKIMLAAAVVIHAFIGTAIAQEKEGVSQFPYFQIEERRAAEGKAMPETSSDVTRQGLTPPGNDNFANATVLPGAGTVTISNVDATGEIGEPIHGAGNGGALTEQNSIWYKYVALSNSVLTVSTASVQSGPMDDTVISVYTGSSLNALTPVAENDDFPGNGLYSRVSFCLTAGQTYYIAVDGYGSLVGSATLSLVLFAKAPNDNFVDATQINYPISSYPGLTQCTVGATAEAGEPTHNGNGGAASVWYRFTTSVPRSITVSTVGSNFDTVLAVYTGTSVGALTEVVSNDDFGPSGTRSSRVTFMASAGVVYRVALTGFNAHAGTSIIYFQDNREQSSKRFDFNGDRSTDIGIFRPSNGQWWLNRGGGQTVATTFGDGTDKMTPADFTGDGKVDIAFWRPSNGGWYILRSEDSSYYEVPFGTVNDIPAAGHFDNDARADLVVFRPSTGTWYISGSRGQTFVVQFGSNGDMPVVADYDGDGISDLAIYRPSNGQWWIRRSKLGVIATTFGTVGDKAIPADYTGDGRADVALFRPATGEWLVLRSEDNSYYAFPFGTSSDIPAPGDYDYDGRTDAAVFRSGTWYVQGSGSGTMIVGFGSAGDKPVASSYIN